MSSDNFFDDSTQVDTAFLDELDAIEAAHSNATPLAHPPETILGFSTNVSLSSSLTPPELSAISIQSQTAPQAAHVPIDVDADESYGQFLDSIDVVELERLDKDVEEAYKQDHRMPSASSASGSGATLQLTLFGEVLSSVPPRSLHSPQGDVRSRSNRSPPRPFGKNSQKLKKWDHTAFSKSGWFSAKSGKAKAEGRVMNCDEEVDETAFSSEEFEQFPAPVKDKYSFSPPPPFKHKPDLLAAQTWVYPTNKPKRDYQFNIARDSLFENTLVALPTGLGKTFIAGVVMLNYYRWFPEGKVVFVAPTKPLVAQQIEACHKICGIPGGDAAELTGQTSRTTRAKAWGEKHVFYMTPQTLMNDLKTENCDPTDIVLLVIDEAHRGTGNYAYAQVVRYLMAKNGHFRILALTATPGSKPEAVQAIIDSLHISNIAIRDENSIDLRQYILPKKISTHIVKMSTDVIKVRDMLAKLMEKVAKRMIDTGLVYNLNVVTLHSYRCSALMQQFGQNGIGKKFPWVYGVLKKLGVLARAMGYLLESSIAMCRDEICGISTEAGQDGKGATGLRAEPLFKDIVNELERQQNSSVPSLHPKLDKLEALAVNYFAQAKADAEEATAVSRTDPVAQVDPCDGKMMVFTNFRSSVDEIVEVLNTHQPMIRPVRFIGQGLDKQGRKGIAQKDQLEVLKKFKEGIYNVLVATSIGEEGLDIGEVDMIICYDAQKTPIRMLQRVGRTGRKRAGRVEVLLSEAREEANWEKARSDYELVQSSITRGEFLELYADVDRLLPDYIKPRGVETFVAIEEYARDAKTPKVNTSIPKVSKRKRDVDVMRNIPEGAVNGFILSSKLISKRDPKRCKVISREHDPDKVSDDDDDRAIESGIHGPLPTEPQRKGKARAKTKVISKLVKQTNKGKTHNQKTTSSASNRTTLSQLAYEVEDDTDDMEIELGIRPPATESPQIRILSTPLMSPAVKRSSQKPLSDTTETRVQYSDHGQHVQEFCPMEDHSWLLDSEDDTKAKDISPSVMHTCKNFESDRCQPSTPPVSSGFKRSPLSHIPSPNNVASPSDSTHGALITITTNGFPEPTFPIRPPGIRRKRRPRISSSPTIEPLPENAPFSLPASSPTHPPVCKKRRQNRIDLRANPGLLDLEAEVSGDGSMTHSSDSEDDTERESDRRFVEELPPTQASPNYNQTSAYRQSLFTQPSNHAHAPQFTSKPVRRGVFGPEKQNVVTYVSCSPTNDQEPDKYSIDSFVVEDDDDILLRGDSHTSDI